MKKYISKEALIVLAIGLVVFFGGMAVGNNTSQSLGASGTRMPNGISADTTSPIAGQVRGTTLTITGATTLASISLSGSFVSSGSITASSTSAGTFTQGGGIVTISTTSAAYTMTAAELASGHIISIANTALGDPLALTLPATSTWTTLIPVVGDSRTWFIQNLHSDAATTTTITTAVGIDLQGVAATSDIINGAVEGRLDCYRQATTDVVCIVQEFVNAE